MVCQGQPLAEVQARKVGFGSRLWEWICRLLLGQSARTLAAEGKFDPPIRAEVPSRRSLSNFVSILFQFGQLFLQDFQVDLMHHQKLSIHVENWNVILVPLKPDTILWIGDVHLLQDEPVSVWLQNLFGFFTKSARILSKQC